MGDVIFELKGVEYSYLGKFPALCGVDLTVRAGDRVAVIGANGTGKSTLLHLLDGLIFPDRGTVKAFGKTLTEDFLRDPENSRSFRRRVGLVFQNADIQLFCPAVRDDIAFGPLQLGFEEPEVRKRVAEAAQDWGLEPLLDRAPHQLSVGEKRKVAIAAVLAIDPDVIILDEPTAGLDPRTSRHIIDIILRAHQAGKTILTSTHDLHIVDEIADIVHVFDHTKKIIRSGSPVEILEDAEFLERNNLTHVHGHRHGGKIHIHVHTPLEKHSGGHNNDKA